MAVESEEKLLPLDVPYVPDCEWEDFLAKNVARIECLHFSLHDPSVADARQLLHMHSVERLVSGLSAFPGQTRLALVNARFHRPDRYSDKIWLDSLTKRLELLLASGNLDGIVFVDGYLLNALGRHAPSLAAEISAVPGVNHCLDTPAKALSVLQMIERAGFARPVRFVPDRTLNRDRKTLARVVAAVRKMAPGVRISLLANEGCLPHCPYKLSHDALLSHVRAGGEERTFSVNLQFGCVQEFLSEPWRVLASPFIRPEDAGLYAGLADSLKICGRNRGVPFLKTAVGAYVSGKWHGNLLDYMDAMGDLADKLYVDNSVLPNGFGARVAECRMECPLCCWCEKHGAAVQRKKTGLPDLRA